MPEPLARFVVLALTGYVAVGIPFALTFVAFGIGRVDPVARSGGTAFRVLVIPGAVLLWPWLAVRWVRRAEPRDERNAHRDAARERAR